MNISGELINALASLVATGRPLRPFIGFTHESDAAQWVTAMVEATEILQRFRRQTAVDVP